MGKISKNKILVDLINNQKNEVQDNKKLDVKSLQRISRNIEDSIFSNKCVLWQGYVTYISSTDTHYINFFFNKKKHALHRLLYLNYIGEVKPNEYLKYKCENKGKCCNINHIYKINNKKHLEMDKSDTKLEESEKDIDSEDKSSKDNKEINIVKDKNDKNKLLIIF